MILEDDFGFLSQTASKGAIVSELWRMSLVQR
jgi:hypothetical protein